MSRHYINPETGEWRSLGKAALDPARALTPQEYVEQNRRTLPDNLKLLGKEWNRVEEEWRQDWCTFNPCPCGLPRNQHSVKGWNPTYKGPVL